MALAVSSDQHPRFIRELEGVVAKLTAAVARLATSQALPVASPNESGGGVSSLPWSSHDPDAHSTPVENTRVTRPHDHATNTAAARDIELYPHQHDAVLALHSLLHTHGCALLADEPGLGKTYTALFVARQFRHTCVVAPASLIDMWRDSARRTRLTINCISYEALSRTGQQPRAHHPLIIFDEAHYLRTPSTRRYQHAAALSWGSTLLFLSATPIHNRRRDLLALFALALGSGCYSAPDHHLARLVVRRRSSEVGHHVSRNLGALRLPPSPHSHPQPLPRPLPELRTLTWEAIPADPQLLNELVALPPPLPPRDGGRADALVRLALVRAWCSSDAALLDAVRRRLATAAALEHALSNGAYPTRAELRSWLGDADAIQLGFPELFSPSAHALTAELLESITQHTNALRLLRTRVTSTHARDHIRFARLREVLDAHAELPALVFTHSRVTARAAFRALAPYARCALLTGETGQIASGSVPRIEILHRFSAEAHSDSLGASNAPPQHRYVAPGTGVEELWRDHPGRAPPRVAAPDLPTSTTSRDERDPMRIDVLVATDVVSEGVNLPRAGIVVHLDLPWTPARIEQRVGRARRLGSLRHEVLQVAIAPPVDGAELQSVLRHLGEKGAVADRLVHHATISHSALLPTIPPTPAIRGATDATARLSHIVSSLSDALAHARATAATRIPSETLAHAPLLLEAEHPIAVVYGAVPSPLAFALVSHHGHTDFVTQFEEAMDPAGDTGRTPNESLNRAAVYPRVAVSTDPRDAATPLEAVLAAVRHSPPRSALSCSECPHRIERLRPIVHRMHARLGEWCRARDAEDAAIGAIHIRSPSHRAILRRIAQLASRGRLARRSLAPLSATLRALVLQTSGIGGESALRALEAQWNTPNESHRTPEPATWLRHGVATLQPRIRGPSLLALAAPHPSPDAICVPNESGVEGDSTRTDASLVPPNARSSGLQTGWRLPSSPAFDAMRSAPSERVVEALLVVVPTA